MGQFIRITYGASGFIVGMRPKLGLPDEPWVLAILIVVCEVLPQGPLPGQ